MYDLKTHDPDYIRNNLDQYQSQINVYAYIWKTLRQQNLDEAAIISTQFPESLRAAWGNAAVDPARFEEELKKWQPVINVLYDELRMSETVRDFEAVVDNIEDGRFPPAPLRRLKEVEARDETFGSRICRNCDARFSCRSYRDYAGMAKKGKLKKFYDDYGANQELEVRRDVAVDASPEVGQMMVNL